MQDIADKFLAEHPDLERVEFIYVDINGVPRGKICSSLALKKAFAGDIKIPISSYILDVWGDNPPDIDIVVSGDADGVCVPVASSIAMLPWSSCPTAQCLLSTKDIDNTPLFADPRNVLKSVLDRFDKLGLVPVVAPEIEFYLIDKELTYNGHPQMLIIKGTSRRYSDVQLLNLSEIDDFEDFFNLVHKSAKSLNIPMESIVKECSPGQFEINLAHGSDALLVADQSFLLKRMLKACAKKFNMNATFMAKPFSNEIAGNGMHIHLSIVDKAGSNVFTIDANNKPCGIFAKAIAGIIKTTPDFCVFYAPHENSYKRLVANYKADSVPTTLSWGHENRTALIRLPKASTAATRLEFRAASADANPYLVLASILSGVLSGIEYNYQLTKEAIGNIHSLQLPKLNIGWQNAVYKASTSPIVADFFGKKFQKVYQSIKEAEIKKFATTITDFEYDSYLRHF